MKADRLIALAAAGLGAVAFSTLPVTPRLVWNRTDSMPRGLYVLNPEPELERGMVVAYTPSPGEAAFLETHHYTGRGWPLVKRVAALEGDEVCRRAGIVLINGDEAALALARDGSGRALPAWTGCQRLGPDDVLLLADHPKSVDGRYFGVQDTRRILGPLRPLRVDGRRGLSPARGAPDEG